MKKYSVKASSLLFLKLMRRTGLKFVRDRTSAHAASIAFYTIFSLPAIAIILFRIASLFVGEDAVTGNLYSSINQFMGTGPAEQVEAIVGSAYKSSKGLIITIASIIVLVWTSTTVFSAIKSSMNEIWGIKREVSGFALFQFLKTKLIMAGLVLSVTFLFLITIAIDSFLVILNDQLGKVFVNWQIDLVSSGSKVITFIVAMLAFAMAYQVMPDRRVRWKYVWLGALLTSALFFLGKFLLNLYFSYFSIADTYGAASAMILLLLWVYYSTLIFLYGAQFTKVYTDYWLEKQKKRIPEQTIGD